MLDFCSLVNSAITLSSILTHLLTSLHLADAYVIRFQQNAVRILDDCTGMYLGWVEPPHVRGHTVNPALAIRNTFTYK